jgi:ribonuclease R
LVTSKGTKILSITVLSLDADGFAIGEILDSTNQIEIPFNTNNIDFNLGDILLVEAKEINNVWIFIKIIKKVNIERKQFFAIVKLKSKNLILQELERGSKYKEKIEPIPSNNYSIKNGDIVRAQIASGKILNKIKIKKIKKNKLRNKREKLFAEILEVIGSSFDPKTFSYLSIKENNIRNEFNENIKNELKLVNASDINKRTDIKSIPFVTIDGDDAKDFDDAVFAEKTHDNMWRILVSIADVSHFVKLDSNLDKEAKERGNSVYLPNLVIPMLPEELSNDLCSLKPNVDRLCLTVEIILNNDGKKLSHKFFRSIINSQKRLTYREVENIINNKTPYTDYDNKVIEVIESLYEVYLILQKLREQRGALNLDLPEKKILFDDKNWPTEVKKVYGLKSNKIIEELMILANVCAAEEIQKYNSESIYRIHEPPSPEKYKSLIDLIGKPLANNLIGKIPHPSLMNKILEQTKETPDYEMINQSILRSQSQAKYNNINKSHFGLALKNYVHFTSPIRRYADLLIHRQIIEIINTKPKKKNDTNLKQKNNLDLICEHISSTERKAIVAERKTIDRLIALIYQERINEIIECVILSVHKFGIFVSIDEGIADALMPVRELPYDWYEYNEKKQSLTGESNGLIFNVGMKLKAKITEVDSSTGSILVKLDSSFYNGEIRKLKGKRYKRK